MPVRAASQVSGSKSDSEHDVCASALGMEKFPPFRLHMLVFFDFPGLSELIFVPF
jgi:hypothetical protein